MYFQMVSDTKTGAKRKRTREKINQKVGSGKGQKEYPTLWWAMNI